MEEGRAAAWSLGRCQVFGPLPQLYRVLIGSVAVVCFLGAGVWLSHLTFVPLPLPLGATLGALAGVAVAWALLHDDHRRPGRVRGR